MTSTQTETYGKANRVLQALAEHAEVFTAGHLNVEAMQANLSGLIEQALAADAHQEALKAETKASTVTVEAINRRVEVTGSSYLDMMSGAVQKDSPLAKTLREIRSKVRRPADSSAQPTVQPTPHEAAQ